MWGIILIQTVDYIQYALFLLIWASVILSWIPPLKGSGFGRLVCGLAEPILYPVKKLLSKTPLGGSGFFLDFSPIIATLLIEMIARFLITLIGSAFGMANYA